MGNKWPLLSYYIRRERDSKRRMDRFTEYIDNCNFTYLLRYELFRLQAGLLDDLVDEMIAKGLWK